jgi:putative solute:sodium symporter small subunit
MEPTALPDSAPTGPQSGANCRAIAPLLGCWVLVTFGVAYFARDLQFHVFGWPFSFWMGAQGGVLAYVAITWLYARRMARLERRPD